MSLLQSDEPRYWNPTWSSMKWSQLAPHFHSFDAPVCAWTFST